MNESIKSNNEANINLHLANERTFLAWIRTSIGIIAFGFVIEKFALFMKQMSLIVGKGEGLNLSYSRGYSSIVGIIFVAFGTLLSLLAYIRFNKVKKQIDQGNWQQASNLDLLLTGVVFVMGTLLVVYLIQNGLSGTES